MRPGGKENRRSTTPPSTSTPEEVVMFRIIAWLLIAAYLLVVGLWPTAAAPVALAFDGLGAVIAAIPGPVLLLAAAVAWLKHRPALKTATA